MVDRPTVCVLLAAYKGSKHITEQINSILSQKGVYVRLIVSVDGDYDLTHFIVEKISQSNENVIYVKGESVSSASENFYRLFKFYFDNIEFHCQFVAFSDQDDIWFKNRLVNACSCLNVSKGSGYSSSALPFDRTGAKFSKTNSHEITKYDYLYGCAGPGCSFVLRSSIFLKFVDFIFEQKYLTAVSAHDWLVYAWFRNFGEKWCFDPVPSIYYRQHDTNVAGANIGVSAFLRRMHAALWGWYRRDIFIIHQMYLSFGLRSSIPFLKTGRTPMRTFLNTSYFIYLKIFG